MLKALLSRRPKPIGSPLAVIQGSGGQLIDEFNYDGWRAQTGLTNVSPNALAAYWLKQVAPSRGQITHGRRHVTDFRSALGAPGIEAKLVQLSIAFRADMAVGREPFQTHLAHKGAGEDSEILHESSLDSGPLDHSNDGRDLEFEALLEREFSRPGLFLLTFRLADKVVMLAALSQHPHFVFDPSLGTIECAEPKNLAQCVAVLVKWNARKAGVTTLDSVKLTRYQRIVASDIFQGNSPPTLRSVAEGSGGRITDPFDFNVAGTGLANVSSNSLVAYWLKQIAARGMVMNLGTAVRTPEIQAKLVDLSAAFSADAAAGREPFQAHLKGSGIQHQSTVDARPITSDFYHSDHGRELEFEALLEREFSRPGLFLLTLRGVWGAERAVMLAASSLGPQLAFDPSLGTLECLAPQNLAQCVAGLVKWNTRHKVGFNTLMSSKLTRYGR